MKIEKLSKFETLAFIKKSRNFKRPNIFKVKKFKAFEAFNFEKFLNFKTFLI